MSDPFDPEAWPRSSGASSPRDDENDNVETTEDDFNPFATDDDQTERDYDSSTFGSSATYGEDDNPYGTYEEQGTYGQDDEDDPWNSTGGTTYGAGDQDDFSYESTTGTAAGGQDNEYRDEFDDYDDDFSAYEEDEDFGDEDDYDDSEFDDREPEQGNNVKRILAVVGVLVVAGLLGGGILLFLGGGNGDKTASPTTTQATAKQTTTTTQGSQPTTTPTTGATTGAQTPAPKDVTDTLNNALAAWGKFAVNGDINDVRPYFVEDSNQYNRFKLDAAAIASQPPGGAAITVTMANPQTFQGDDANSWLIRGTATWARPGEATQNFPWEIRMVRSSDRQPWQISSVRQF